MINAEPPAGVTTFTYNTDGQRVAKESTDGVTGFLYDHKRLLHETDDLGDVENIYVNATQDEYGDLLNEYGEESERFHQFDAQASTNALVDPECDVQGRFKYDAFGSVHAFGQEGMGWASLTTDQWAAMTIDEWAALPIEGATTSGTLRTMGFGSQRNYYADLETELYLLGGGGGGRYYDPKTGRFTSEDPLRHDAGDENLYRYVGNDPVNQVDPSGLAVEDVVHWHHELAKTVFDPADSQSFLNQLGMQLEQGIDIHSKDYGWQLSAQEHARLHSNDFGQKWELRQRAWLRTQRDLGRSTITKAMLDGHLRQMRVDFGLTTRGVTPRNRVGSKATIDYPNTKTYYTGLNDKGRLLRERATAPGKLPEVPSRLRRVGRALGRAARVLGPLAGILGYREARAAGAGVTESIAVGVIDAANPIPVSAMEAQQAGGEAVDEMRTWADEKHQGHMRKRFEAAGLEEEPW